MEPSVIHDDLRKPKSIALFAVLFCLTVFCLFPLIDNSRKYFNQLMKQGIHLASHFINNTKPVCTLQSLKQHALEHRVYSKFPFAQIGTNGTFAPPGDYSCWFPNSAIRRNLTTPDNCQPVSRILLLGDSNGRRYTDAMVSWIQVCGWSCNITKEAAQQLSNRYLPDINYFIREPMIKLDHIRYRSQDCHSCASVKYECTQKSGKRLTLEYLSVQYLIDAEITTVRKGKMCKERLLCDQSNTYQEFIFREYLAGRYPDVFFYFLNSHDLGRSTLKHIKLSAEYFFNIVDSYMPKNSIVFLISSMKRVLHRDPHKFPYENNLNSNQKQYAINKIVYEAAESRLKDENKQWYAFPDLYDESNTTDHLYSDYIHRTPIWYEDITRHLLQLICFL